VSRWLHLVPDEAMTSHHAGETGYDSYLRDAQQQVSFSGCLSLFTCDSIYAIARICHGNSVCLSVCPSDQIRDTRVDQSKTVEARITQFSPYSSPIPLVFRG